MPKMQDCGQSWKILSLHSKLVHFACTCCAWNVFPCKMIPKHFPTIRASRELLPPFSVEVLAAMLRRENELRLCPETQKDYAEAEKRNDTDWMEVGKVPW